MLDAWLLFVFLVQSVWVVGLFGVGAQAQDTDAVCLDQFGWVSLYICCAVLRT